MADTISPSVKAIKAALTSTQLQALKGQAKAYKFTDRDGMYVNVTPAGSKSFRYDYRINGRRETLVIGSFDADASTSERGLKDLSFGMPVTLAEARTLLGEARRAVARGESPSRAKADKRSQAAEALTFAKWAERYFEDKANPSNGGRLANSTLAMRRSLYRRDLEGPLGKLKLDEITPSSLMALCMKIKARGAPAPAVQAREIVLLVYRFAQSQEKGTVIVNPADSISPSDIATFSARERSLKPAEIRALYPALDATATAPTLRLAVKFVLLTLVRKSEFVDATWDEVDFDAATWTIPAARMKSRRDHVVYLSQQALDILTTLRACFPSSSYLHPSRYESDLPISDATLNRVLEVAIKRLQADDPGFEKFSMHDLRRTASSLLNEAGFNRDWIEKALAHEEQSVRGVYNKAQYGEQRRVMLQAWADMIDAWVRGEKAQDIVRAARISAMDVSMEVSM